MKFKLFLLCLVISCVASAQRINLFKPIPKFTKYANAPNGHTLIASANLAAPITKDSIFWALRPVATALTLYIEGDVQAAAGGGLSYQNITQRASDGRNIVNYSANFVVLAGGAVTDNANKSDIEKFAIYLAALNNTVGLGYGMSHQLNPVTLKKQWKGGLAVVWTYNFNN